MEKNTVELSSMSRVEFEGHRISSPVSEHKTSSSVVQEAQSSNQNQMYLYSPSSIS